MTGADDPDNRRLMRFDEQLSYWERGMLAETQRIVKIRNAHTALRYGDFLTLRADETIYAYLRADFNERLLVVLNKSEQPMHADLLIPEAINARAVVDINTGESFTVATNKVSIPIAGIGWRVLKID